MHSFDIAGSLPMLRDDPRSAATSRFPMNDLQQRLSRTGWIPWVIALAVLFALNALAPDRSFSGKSDTPQDIGLSVTENDAQPAGRTGHLPIMLAPPPTGGIGGPACPPQLPRLAGHREAPAAAAEGGAVQGRAPPVKRFC